MATCGEQTFTQIGWGQIRATDTQKKASPRINLAEKITSNWEAICGFECKLTAEKEGEKPVEYYPHLTVN